MSIPGLVLVENFITIEEEKQLLDFIDSGKYEWNTTIKRRTMHFGYNYNYSQGAKLEKTIDIPEEFNSIIQKLNVEQPINQIIINEYLPGQGISPHIDSLSFGDTIVSLSLGSDAIMEFTKISMTKTEEVEILLKKRGVVYLTDESRKKWRHSIPARKTDKIGDKKITRERRVSLTFRHVKTI